jgi:hypothetical protein
MKKSRALLVYFSRTGTTKGLAEGIRKTLVERGLDCDVEPLEDRTDRRGLFGYLRSSFDGGIGRSTKLFPTKHNPSLYDVVILGTPVWNASVSAPIRTYLSAQAGRLPPVAFFLTFGSSGSARAFRKLRKLAGRSPIAELAVREREVTRGTYVTDIPFFADSIEGCLRKSVVSATTIGQPSFAP